MRNEGGNRQWSEGGASDEARSPSTSSLDSDPPLIPHSSFLIPDVGDFERPKDGRRYDETDISLRAYVARQPWEKLAAYDASWSDEQVIAWDDNFRDDGELMLVCCERDVGVTEFRAVVEEYRVYAGIAPSR